MSNPKLKILIVSPEVVPFAKTGGLADVAGALPKALAQLGHEVKVILPKYKMVDENKFKLETVPLELKDMAINSTKQSIGLKKFVLNSLVEYLFLVNDYYYNRPELYRDIETNNDYKDNDERFIFFAKAVLEIFKKLNWQPDIIHCNDWQSGLIPAYLKTLYGEDPFFQKTASIFTIHNIAYQGNFPAETFSKLGIDNNLFYPTSPFEFWGKLSFLKAGIFYTDVINTVSETYAQEIQNSNEYGCGMEGILKVRSDNLFGVVNGIDYEEWSPEKDKLLPFHFNQDDLSGKKRNKEELLRQSGFPILRKDVPLIGIISRLADQKGFDLLAEISEELMSLDLKIVILGTGDKKYHELFARLQEKYPKKIKINLAFDNKLAHLIEAGADMFLMPSRYEPCGLNQLYSLKYGTVPIVRKTGGLADTIQDYNEKSKEGTGFVFENYNSSELLETIKRALKVYKRKKEWENLQVQGMEKDYSWKNSAQRYVELYQKALAGHRVGCWAL
jgi:starch synthase